MSHRNLGANQRTRNADLMFGADQRFKSARTKANPQQSKNQYKSLKTAISQQILQELDDNKKFSINPKKILKNTLPALQQAEKEADADDSFEDFHAKQVQGQKFEILFDELGEDEEESQELAKPHKAFAELPKSSRFQRPDYAQAFRRKENAHLYDSFDSDASEGSDGNAHLKDARDFAERVAQVDERQGQLLSILKEGGDNKKPE